MLRFAPFAQAQPFMQMPRASYRLHAGALLSYAAVALFFNWPLPLDLGGSLHRGPFGGDTGVYVWNTWLFRHECSRTDGFHCSQEILSLTPPVDLSLHNYTLFTNLLAFPLIPLSG